MSTETPSQPLLDESPTVEEPSHEEELQYATLGERFAGMIIDGIFLALMIVPMAVGGDFAAFYLLVYLVFVLFYSFILEGIHTNQTVGKYVMRMRVARDDGEHAGILNSVIRNTVGAIGQAFGWIGLLVGAFAIYQSDTNKRIGDSAAGTVVVKIPRSG